MLLTWNIIVEWGVPLPSVVKATTCDLPHATFHIMGAASSVVDIRRWCQAPSSPKRFGEQSNGLTQTGLLESGEYAAINPTPRDRCDASCRIQFGYKHNNIIIRY